MSAHTIEIFDGSSNSSVEANPFEPPATTGADAPKYGFWAATPLDRSSEATYLRAAGSGTQRRESRDPEDTGAPPVDAMLKAMLGLFSAPKRPAQRPAEIPPGLRVYAIGDVHGRADLLALLHDKIVGDACGAAQLDHRIVYLGDYVDRGPSSREVLDMLITAPPAGFTATHLMGNHEALLLQFLDDAGCGPEWLAIGGLATLFSYGVGMIGDASMERKLLAAQHEFRQRLPRAHREFLAGLPRHTSIGDYFFAHAGVRPGIPLERQSDTDLIWIRGEFLESTSFHGKIVVHGHSYKTEPELLPNRIGIDTGAYATGRLTCLVLERQSVRFL